METILPLSRLREVCEETGRKAAEALIAYYFAAAAYKIAEDYRQGRTWSQVDVATPQDVAGMRGLLNAPNWSDDEVLAYFNALNPMSGCELQLFKRATHFPGSEYIGPSIIAVRKD